MQRFNKIWVKLSIAFVGIIFVIMLLVLYFFTIRQLQFERVALRKNMGRIARQIASIRLAETEGWYVYQDWIDNIIASDIGHDLVYIAIFDEKNSLAAFGINYKWLDLADSGVLSRAEQIQIVKSLSQGQIADESRQDFDHFSVQIQLGREMLGAVDVGFSLIDFNNKFRRQIFINLYLLLLFLLVGILASVFIGLRITRPLNRLSNALVAVSNSNFDQVVAVRSNDEIGSLANSFNFMTTRLREKNIIENFSRELGFTWKFDQIIQLVIEKIATAVSARYGVLFVMQSNETFTRALAVGAYPQSPTLQYSCDIDASCIQRLLFYDAPFSPAQLQETECHHLLLQISNDLQIETFEYFIPLVSKNSLLGFILLAPQTQNCEFDNEEINFLITLGAQAAMAVENAILLQQLTEKERLKQELEIAREVQKRLLPQKDPQIAGLDISGVCLPAEEVGGDYFDYFYIDEHHLGLAIADVSGKGTSAAFYMAELKGMMTSLACTVLSPTKLLSIINRQLGQTLDKRIYTTMLYGVLDLQNRCFNFVRAGHNALIVRRFGTKDNIEMFIPSGIALGLADEATFAMHLEEKMITLNPGDILALYTDGVPDAMNAQLIEFTEERFIDLIRADTDLDTSTRHLQERILAEIEAFKAGNQQHDDITMILARFL